MNRPQVFDSRQLDALMNLIDDPDEIIYDQVRNQIISFGESVIPMLESYWEKDSFGNLFQVRIEDIIHEIQFSSVQVALQSWFNQGGEDLLEGMLILNRYQYPDLDDLVIRDEIARIRQDIWLELNDNLTAFEQVKVMNEIIFGVHRFKGNKRNYHAAKNTFLDQVLQSRKGNPLSLSMLYIILANSLDIPIYGVNLPHHFILAYEDRFNVNPIEPEEDNPKVLFYINPFSKGALLDKTEIERFLKHVKLKPSPRYYEPCDNRQMILRAIHNLMFSYQHTGDTDKVKELKILAAIFE